MHYAHTLNGNKHSSLIENLSQKIFWFSWRLHAVASKSSFLLLGKNFQAHVACAEAKKRISLKIHASKNVRSSLLLIQYDAAMMCVMADMNAMSLKLFYSLYHFIFDKYFLSDGWTNIICLFKIPNLPNSAAGNSSTKILMRAIGSSVK